MPPRTQVVLTLVGAALIVGYAAYTISHQRDLRDSVTRVEQAAAEQLRLTAAMELSGLQMVATSKAGEPRLVRRNIELTAARWTESKAQFESALTEATGLFGADVTGAGELHTHTNAIQGVVDQLLDTETSECGPLCEELVEQRDRLESATAHVVSQLVSSCLLAEKQTQLRSGAAAAAAFALMGVAWLSQVSTLSRIGTAVAQLDSWNSTQLEEVNKLRKQHTELAREIFSSRRAEEELRGALADIWAVASKMHDEPQVESPNLKTAIPMAPRSRVSG